MLRLMGLTLLLNLLALPLYLIFPGINLFLFLVLNGYLLGRGYFEVIALRRLDAAAAKAVRNRFGGRIFVGGGGVAGVFPLPLGTPVAPRVPPPSLLRLLPPLPRHHPPPP